MKYCIHCGSEMPDEAEFCGNCGKGVKGKQVSGKSGTKKPLIIGCSIGIVLVSIIVVSLFAMGVIFGKKDDTTHIQEINEPREQEKKDDKTRLQEIIAEQKAQGAKVKGIVEGSGDGSSDEHQYVWDDEGNLVGLSWADMEVSGDISFSDFTHLEVLLVFNDRGNDPENERMTSLDVSGCSALTTLACSKESQLESLDVSGCTMLTELECHGGSLRGLDLSDCKSLQKLYCPDNQLSSLDVSNCTVLEELNCIDNQLSSLDVSACKSLQRLDCEQNQLSSLDISECKSLQGLDCAKNQLSNLDVSACKSLQRLLCHDNQLSSLDVSACTKLEDLSTDSSCIVEGYEEK